MPLNNAQELFLVLFSILYGVMLQSLSALAPFPLGRIFRGYKTRDGQVKEDFKLCGGKSNNQLTRMWRKRVLLSFVTLNILPMLYFLGILSLLDRISVSFSYSSLLDSVFIFWSALGVFGFYRLFHALFAWKWKRLFCDVLDEEFEKIRPVFF